MNSSPTIDRVLLRLRDLAGFAVLLGVIAINFVA
ncbi:DNA polymerase III subunit alpha [Parvularcula bermudensis HTCC2503]|uniref:DNA polymerase III subunit alpha n=1 Tax=Parvularcula bermudensis (strain ATCC BAA-594 / HTCC2503 / KCTC 12087) TaxID=314260 RepID=E0TCR6_PARBH|nr:DNA polymerase III subunit alpha [Parvularcula bermudensis HTCC2503]